MPKYLVTVESHCEQTYEVEAQTKDEAAKEWLDGDIIEVEHSGVEVTLVREVDLVQTEKAE